VLAVVIPAYRSRDQILDVLARIPEYVDRVFVIDDLCPERTGKTVQLSCKDGRVSVHFNDQNLGVGGAVIVGFKLALEAGASVVVKIDSDGQMDPAQIINLLSPIYSARADYTKGNRFNSLEDLQAMPKVRVVGNAALSLLSKVSSGYWSVNDPTNGFFAITRGALQNISLGKLRTRWFFESDLLFRLAIARAAVIDVPIAAKYGSETSNLRAYKVVFPFLWRHLVNFFKRILYLYYLREWSVASFQLPASLTLLGSGMFLGLSYWSQSAAAGQATTTGQVMLAVLPILIGFQLLLSFLGLDVANEPRQPLYVNRKDESGASE
jgi:dolichol-phosphate mannosyltransferase